MCVHNSVHSSPVNSDRDDDVQDPDHVTRLSKLDISDLLHLHPNDNTALTVVSIKLKGTENYQFVIPLSRESFDVIVGMDWLSKRKFVIVCHEKVVEIPLEGSRKLRVQGERTLGAAKALMNAKVDERKVGDISVVRDFVDVFLEDFQDYHHNDREDYSTERLEKIYIDEIVARHGVPVSIILDRDGRFTSRCWPNTKGFRDEVGYEVMAYHPQTLVKRSTKAAERASRAMLIICSKPLEFEEGDQVLLKVSPWKGVVRFGKKGKLALRYVGPFKILERIGPIAYRLRLPKELSGVHDTFHVSNLKKCLADASLHVPLDEI
ncbi:putative reverse transcriptase domain-containing protein [Tanacetum coccineum]